MGTRAHSARGLALQLYLAIKEEINLDELALLKGWPISKTATLLTQMELKGAIRSLGGKRYEKT